MLQVKPITERKGLRGKNKLVIRNKYRYITKICDRYYAGWADKNHGKTIPVDGPFLSYTRSADL